MISKQDNLHVRLPRWNIGNLVVIHLQLSHKGSQLFRKHQRIDDFHEIINKISMVIKMIF